jgi:sporulation protein YlmC with PRC-barrel domain
MSEVLLSHLLGRKVYDVDGRSLGRLEELRAEIELHERGVDYVVVEFHVGAYGALEALAGGHFARHLLRLFAPLSRYRRYRVPWEWMDLGDPERPVVMRPAGELSTRME